MTSRPAPNQRFISDFLHEVGKECDYWKKFGEYAHQQATEEGWLDAHGKLTPPGLQAIVSEQESSQHRGELTKLLKPRASNSKDRFKINGLHIKTPSSPRRSMKTPPSLRTKKGVRSAFVVEVKTLLSKTEIGFVHFQPAEENSQLKVRVPTERGGTTSRTFVGTMSEIRQGLYALTKEVEEKK